MTYYVHFESPDMCEGCLLYILLVVLRKMKRKNLNLNQSLCVVETDSEETDCGYGSGSWTGTFSVHWNGSDSWIVSVLDS